MRWILFCFCFLFASCETDTAADEDFDAQFEGLRAKYGLSALNVGRIEDGQLVRVGAYGIADQGSGQAATPETIYALASVSKVFVGLAVARAIELGLDIDLDADINDYLGWSTPLAHPDFPGTPITLRQLVRHRSGIVADGPDDYDTYPKPDPTGSLSDFLETLLANPESWTEAAPDAAEEYSNLGAALAALVVEKVAGRPFEVFCNEEVFEPLGMRDTRWFYRELSASQRARLARPEGEDGPLEHYGFPDWPSGQLRSTVGDLARAIAMLSDGGTYNGETFLSGANHALFQQVPLFIVKEGTLFNHSGGESGVNTYIEYDENGDGLIILTNQDLEDDALDELFDEAIEALRAWSATDEE